MGVAISLAGVVCRVSSALYLNVLGIGNWGRGWLRSARRSLYKCLRFPFIMCLFSLFKTGRYFGFYCIFNFGEQGKC